MVIEIIYNEEDLGCRWDTNWYSNQEEVIAVLKSIIPNLTDEGKCIFCNSLQEYTNLTAELISVFNTVGKEQISISLS